MYVAFPNDMTNKLQFPESISRHRFLKLNRFIPRLLIHVSVQINRLQPNSDVNIFNKSKLDRRKSPNPLISHGKYNEWHGSNKGDSQL